ncbi:Rotatin [Trichinella spiralis]|uniref:Rotatin n=1 Tax=Trichinella spiralis TaxID=6334 RepID=A0ABR3L2J7_TRISP
MKWTPKIASRLFRSNSTSITEIYQGEKRTVMMFFLFACKRADKQSAKVEIYYYCCQELYRKCYLHNASVPVCQAGIEHDGDGAETGTLPF